MTYAIKVGHIVRLKTGHAPIFVTDIIDGNMSRRTVKQIRGFYLTSTISPTKWRTASDYVHYDKNCDDRSKLQYRYRRSLKYLERTHEFESNLFRNLQPRTNFAINYGFIYTHHTEKEKQSDWENESLDFNTTKPEEKDTTMSNNEPKTNVTLYQVNGKADLFGVYLQTNAVGQYVLEMKGPKGGYKAYKPEDVTMVTPYTVKLVSLTNSTSFTRIVKPGTLEVGDVLIRSDGDMSIVRAIDTKEIDCTKKLTKCRKLVMKEISAD